MQFGKNAKIIRVANATAAGTGAVNSVAVPVNAGERVIFLVAFGVIVTGAATSLKAQGGQAADGSDAADLAGTNVTVLDTYDNGVVALEVLRPTQGYVRCVVSRATQNSTVDAIVALVTGARKAPVVADATLMAYKGVLSPAYGAP